MRSEDTALRTLELFLCCCTRHLLHGVLDALSHVLALLQFTHTALLGCHSDLQHVEGSLQISHSEVHRCALEPQAVAHSLLKTRRLVF